MPASFTPCPTRIRYKILALLTMISIITYVDRVNISVAARQMMPALGLTPLHMGYVFSAFVLGYALFQIPGGWLGDRLGVRKVLAAAILWWSFFTACTESGKRPPCPILTERWRIGCLRRNEDSA